jgi:hypothetical protein
MAAFSTFKLAAHVPAFVNRHSDSFKSIQNTFLMPPQFFKQVWGRAINRSQKSGSGGKFREEFLEIDVDTSK